MKYNSAFGTVNYYTFDFSHYSIGSLCECVRYFITERVYPRFASHFISTYHKFVASVVHKEPIAGISSEKELQLKHTEIVAIPALNVDPNAVEHDETVTPYYWNFYGMNSVFESVINRREAFVAGDTLLIYPQSMYLRINLDCIALFDSVYAKLDFDVKLMQAFRGINRANNSIITLETFIPLPDALLQAYPNIDWTNGLKPVYKEHTRVRYGLSRVVKHTGEVKPHLVYIQQPYLTLTSVSDGSEKYGADKMPHFKTNFNVVVEGYVLTSLVCLDYSKVTNIFATVRVPGEQDLVGALLLLTIKEFFEQLLQKHLTYEEFIELLNDLIQFLSVSLEELLQKFLYALEGSTIDTKLSLLEKIAEFIYIKTGVYLKEWYIDKVLQEIYRKTRLYSHIPKDISILTKTTPLFIINVGGKCFAEMQNEELETIFYTVPEFVDSNDELRIPESVWKIYPNSTFLAIDNVPNTYNLDDNNNIVVQGPLLEGQVLVIFIKRRR